MANVLVSGAQVVEYKVLGGATKGWADPLQASGYIASEAKAAEAWVSYLWTQGKAVIQVYAAPSANAGASFHDLVFVWQIYQK